MNYTIVNTIAAQSGTALGTVTIFLIMIVYISTAPLMPRFIIGIRELYDRDLHGHWKGIDSEFGVLSQPVAGGDAVVSAIAFADVNPGQEEGQEAEGGEDDLEEIRLEVSGNSTQQV